MQQKKIAQFSPLFTKFDLQSELIKFYTEFYRIEYELSEVCIEVKCSNGRLTLNRVEPIF